MQYCTVLYCTVLCTVLCYLYSALGLSAWLALWPRVALYSASAGGTNTQRPWYCRPGCCRSNIAREFLITGACLH